MPDSNDAHANRRQFLRSAASTLGIVAIPGVAATASGSTSGDSMYDFDIKDGEVVYSGPETITVQGTGSVDMSEIVAGMNQAIRQDEAVPVEQNGEVVLKDPSSLATAEPNQVIAPGPGGCAGQSGSTRVGWFDIRIWLDNCETNELANKLTMGAAASQVAAFFVGAAGNIPAALAAESAAVVLGASATILYSTNEGQGVEITIGLPATLNVDSQ